MKVLHLRGPIPLFTNTFVLLDEQGMRDYLQGRQMVIQADIKDSFQIQTRLQWCFCLRYSVLFFYIP